MNDSNIDFTKMNYNMIKKLADSFKDDYTNFNITKESILQIIKLLNEDDRKNVQELSIRLSKQIQSFDTEVSRVKNMYNFDKNYLSLGYIAGVDEVGRGPLAGPIVAAAVVLNLNTTKDSELILGIKDSKKLSSKAREELSSKIMKKAISYSFSVIDSNEIDSKGIAWCNNEVFKIAVSKLNTLPNLVLSDGYPIKNFKIKNNYVIKGDEKSASIACASIIAKVYRDNIMKDYSKIYPEYSFEENSGYGTKEHIDAIKKYGPCKIHRMYFLRNII
ncbi:ribonuclease HII [Clostridium sp. YIM B02515]|uniref:Ribonuclease HII n=2 Tax=Clostridium rhizosphaerae TaxID=2803861 RepID=A0ABS1T818_9CLOT|nr:ribonuclease HII [Clostridium rhizosphaerae]